MCVCVCVCVCVFDWQLSRRGSETKCKQTTVYESEAGFWLAVVLNSEERNNQPLH